jgi:BTB/POZ domain-containing protein 17
METYTKATMSCVRFPMMSPRQLADLLLSPLVTKYKDFFINRLALGMAFHKNDRVRCVNLLFFQNIYYSNTNSYGSRLVQLVEEDPSMLTPRIYTTDSWSTVLTIEKYSEVQPYHTSTLVFSIPSALEECHQYGNVEWVVDFYPRGLWYKKSLLITWEGTKEVPEAVLRTCRLSLTCRDPETIDRSHIHVKIGILVS